MGSQDEQSALGRSREARGRWAGARWMPQGGKGKPQDVEGSGEAQCGERLGQMSESEVGGVRFRVGWMVPMMS